MLFKKHQFKQKPKTIKSFLIKSTVLIDRLHWMFSKLIIRALAAASRRSKNNETKTIVVIRNCFFGDYIVTIPALRRLRAEFPKSKIVLFTTTSFSKYWKNRIPLDDIFNVESGLIDEVVRYTKSDLRTAVGRKGLRCRLSNDKNIVSVVLCYSGENLISRLKKILLCIILDLPFPLGLLGTPTLPFQRYLNKWRMGRSDIEHQVKASLNCVNDAVFALGRTSVLTFAVSQYTHNPKYRSKPIIGVAPFSKQPVKQWPIEKFSETIQRLNQHIECCFEIYGTAEDLSATKKLIQLTGPHVEIKVFCGDISPQQLHQRLESINLLICLDSGPMHLGCLVGTPIVAIFSQITLHQFWAPWGRNSCLVSCNVACTKCETHSGYCPKGANICIDRIEVPTVLASAIRLLNVKDKNQNVLE